MIAEDAIRFLDHQARHCRDIAERCDKRNARERLCFERDTYQAFCLLLPAIRKVLYLEPMDDFEALDFQVKLRHAVKHPEEVLAP